MLILNHIDSRQLLYRMRKALLISFLLLTTLCGFAQKVDIEPSISPEFFQADEQITITYDVTGTSLSNLENAWIWMWIPDNTDWKVTSNENPASDNSSVTDAAKFEKTTVGEKVTFSIQLTLTEFLGLSKEEITSVGMLIKGDDWGDGQSEDAVVPVTQGFTVRFDGIESNYGFYASNDVINLVIKTSETAEIVLYLDDVVLSSAADATLLEYAHTVLDDGTVHILKAVATSVSDEVDEVQYAYTLEPQTVEETLPIGMMNGVNYLADETMVTLVLTAPNKQNVFVIGDFNDWQLQQEYLMKQSGEQFWLTIEGLTPGKEYVFQYLIDGEIVVADPYTEKVSDPWHDSEIPEATYPGLIDYPVGKTSYRASVLQTGQVAYEWQNTDFIAPDKENLMIYELLVRDFDDAHSYKAVIDRLDYLEGLGVNAIELMPVNEFEYNESWGYNPNFYFATDKYYGTKNDLKKLIDECHGRGIAVLIDLVLNHTFNSSPFARMYWNEAANRPAADNPWYNEQHNFQTEAAHWGSDLNHESSYTQALVDSVNSYWLTEYKVDGFRFDFTKGFGNNYKSQSSDEWGSKYDADRIALLKRMVDQIWQVDQDAYVIFEHLAENSEEKELADYGIMLWGNMNGDYKSLAKGFVKDLAGAYYADRGWNDPHLVSYMESHDEERVMWEVFDKTSYTLSQASRRAQLNAAFFFTIPGPKMVWQFGEMGYDEELNNDRLAVKPTHWEYLQDENRRKIYLVYQALMNLRSKTGYVDAEYFEWQSAGRTKWISIDHPELSLVVAGNFGSEEAVINPGFTQNGTWYDYLTGETIEVNDFENFELSVAGSDFKIFTSSQIENYIEESPIVLGAIGKGKELQFPVQIYPNPAKDKIEVKAGTSVSRVRVYDLMGKVHIDQSMDESSEGNNIDVSRLNAGIYMMELRGTPGNKKVVKFIKN